MIKKLTIVILALILMAAMCVWLIPKFQYRHIYFDMINEVAPQPLAVVQGDDTTTALIENIQTNWIRFSSNTEPFSSALPAIGLEPCVSNLVRFFNYRPQNFFPLEEEMIIGEYQALLLLPPIDGSIHLSEDGQAALIRHHTNSVTIYTNDDGKLRESLYFLYDDEESNQLMERFLKKQPEESAVLTSKDKIEQIK